jgi:hypothetical protein
MSNFSDCLSRKIADFFAQKLRRLPKMRIIILTPDPFQRGFRRRGRVLLLRGGVQLRLARHDHRKVRRAGNDDFFYLEIYLKRFSKTPFRPQTFRMKFFPRISTKKATYTHVSIYLRIMDNNGGF